MHKVWQKASIERHKALIKQEMEQANSPVDYATNQIAILEKDPSPQGMVRRFLYVMFALSYHLRLGGLKPKLIRDLGKLGTAILMINGIKATSSKLGFLHGDLEFLLSQVESLSGDQRKAAWRQQMSYYYAQRGVTGGDSFKNLTSGLQALRLGNGGMARQELELVDPKELDGKLRSRYYIETHRILRLAGDIAGAEKFAVEVNSRGDLDSSSVSEWEWELLWRQAIQTQNIRWMIQAVRSGRSHCDKWYFLEAYLLTRMTKSREWLDRLSLGGRHISRNTLRETGKLFSAACALDRCYDSSIPFGKRLEGFESVLLNTSSLRTSLHELLVLGAFIRWLSRNRSRDFARFVLGEYESLSLGLSYGKSTDVLGFLKDLQENLHDSDELSKQVRANSQKLK